MVAMCARHFVWRKAPSQRAFHNHKLHRSPHLTKLLHPTSHNRSHFPSYLTLHQHPISCIASHHNLLHRFSRRSSTLQLHPFAILLHVGHSPRLSQDESASTSGQCPIPWQSAAAVDRRSGSPPLGQEDARRSSLSFRTHEGA